MASRSQSSKNNRPTITYQWIPLEVTSFDPADVGPRKDIHVHSEPHVRSHTQSETKSSNKILSTAEFIIAVGGVWKAISGPYAVSQPKASVQYNHVSQKENVICFSGCGENLKTSTPGAEYFDLKSISCSLPTAKSNFEYLKEIKKMILFGSCKGYANNTVFWRHVEVRDSHLPNGWSINGLRSIGVSYDLTSLYGSISGKPILDSKGLVDVTRIETRRTDEGCFFEKKTPPANLSAPGSVDSNAYLSERRDSSVGETVDLVDKQHSPSSLYYAYSVQPNNSIVEPIFASGYPCSSLYKDYHIEFLASINCSFGECQQPLDSYSEELSASKDNFIHDKSLSNEVVLEAGCPPKLCLSMRDNLDNGFAKKKHALAGALAGTSVSLCLHPVDTIKTIIQARCMNQKSICHTFESIISERGVMGLYRGIASNIASSAPISAVYTFTYESVKGALLPLLPKEYHSLAHCTAGGCASIATSFIFTPSERIKQQMQVRSEYQYCWNALIGVIKKGGLPSLYAGWGAVLCRNIPHSIIKFYTYESLKQQLLRSTQLDARLNTLQTLACGGLAGSTAALFTTPFDVVKTRLQAQVPGSLKQYDGVLHALKEIAKHEGLRGLYRGLTPRLAMYISQGAIFFASYEFFKTAFSLEVPQLPAQIAENSQNMENDCISRLHKLN